MKKGTLNSWMTGGGSSIRTDMLLNWYDRELSDFDDSDTELGSEQHQEDDHAKKPSRRKTNARRRCVQTEGEDEGCIYPLDLWHLLAQHILPEDVRVFAAICRNAYLVVQTANFWHSLYKRFYTPSMRLCDRLLPHSMRKVHGLRARVIRTLFHVYAPFRTRVQTTDPFKRSPDTLEGARCLIMWHRHEKDLWHFFFKFRTNCQCRTTHCCHRRHDNYKEDADWNIATHPADVHYNAEEHCCVVCVVMQNYMHVPPSVMGQVLQSASVSVSHAMRYHKLKLLFTSEFLRSTKDAVAAGCTVIMDPVLNVHLLHWWHPRYPCALS